jgi:hypothetical protein
MIEALTMKKRMYINKTITVIYAFTITVCAYQLIGFYERPYGSIFDASNQGRMSSTSESKMVADNDVKRINNRLVYKPITIENNSSFNFYSTYRNLLAILSKSHNVQ